MRSFNWRAVLTAIAMVVACDTITMLQAEDRMPATIDIVCRLNSGRPVFKCQPVRVEDFPVRNFFVTGWFAEDKGKLYPVKSLYWSLQATPGVLPDNRLLSVRAEVDSLRDGDLIPLCGHVYRFTRKGNEGLLTFMANHPLQQIPTDKARLFSVVRNFTWGEDEATASQIVPIGEGGWLTIRGYTTLENSQAAAIVGLSISKANSSGGNLDLDKVLQFKLDKRDVEPRGWILKVGDHLQTERFDFVVRRIVPWDGKDVPGWIDLELLTGRQPD